MAEALTLRRFVRMQGALHRGIGALLVAVCVLWSQRLAAQAPTCTEAHERGQMERVSGRLVAAREAFAHCTQEACHSLIRGDCRAWLADLDARLATLVFDVVGSDGQPFAPDRVWVDGALAPAAQPGALLRLEPGTHTLRVEARFHAALQQSVTLAAGEHGKRLRFELTDVEPSRDLASAAPLASKGEVAPSGPHGRAPDSRRDLRLRRAAYGLGGLAGGSLLAGGVLQALLGRQYDGFRDCKPSRTCDEDEVSHARARLYASYGMFGAAGALLGTAAVTFFLGRSSRESPAQARVSPRRDGVDLWLRAAF
jgi:hypothetical protein